MCTMGESSSWTVDHELQLFHALRKSKPVGVHKHFSMLRIYERLRDSIQRPISQIWDHLRSMYDLQALDETERLPFPNHEAEFVLPPAEYESLIGAPFPRTTSFSSGAGTASASAAPSSTAEGDDDNAKPASAAKQAASGARAKPAAASVAAIDNHACVVEKRSAPDRPAADATLEAKQGGPEKPAQPTATAAAAETKPSDKVAEPSDSKEHAAASAEKPVEETPKRGAKRGRPPTSAAGANTPPGGGGGSAAKRRRN